MYVHTSLFSMCCVCFHIGRSSWCVYDAFGLLSVYVGLEEVTFIILTSYVLKKAKTSNQMPEVNRCLL